MIKLYNSCFLVKAKENESNMLVQYFLNGGPTCWTLLRQYLQHVGPTFRSNDFIVMTNSLITCDCVAFESLF